MKSTKITQKNHALGLVTGDDPLLVRAKHYNDLKDDFDTLTARVSTILSATVTLTATELVGNSVGDIAHTAGAVLVAAPGVGYVHEFVSATIVYDFVVAAYTGGGSDLVFRVGTVAQSPAITAAQLATNAADVILQVPNIATVAVNTGMANGTINFFAGTAWTQPGTAAGTVTIYVNYRTVATGVVA